MNLLDEFRGKGFGDQIAILLKISNEKIVDAFPGLFSLYNDPTGDKAVDAMVEHTLRGLLNENEREVVKRIAGGTKKDKRLCLEVAGIRKFTGSVATIVQLVRKEKDEDVLTSAFLAMARLDDPAFLESYRKHVNDPNELVAAIAIEKLGAARDKESLPKLTAIVEKGESIRRYKLCSLTTAKAIEAVASIGDHDASTFLVDKIHHKNPTARRFITEALIQLGEAVLPLLEKVFDDDNVDRKIIAADVIGWIGKRKGGSILISATDRGAAEHPNVRFAIYEALGKISSSKGALFLAEALQKEEHSCLTAVVSSLEKQFSPFIVDTFASIISSDETHGNAIIKTIIVTRAENIFAGLYAGKDQSVTEIGGRLIDALLSSNDPLAVEVFKTKLETIEGPQVDEDLKKLSEFRPVERQYRVLAVDDSTSMRDFYISLGAGLNAEVMAAEHGEEAVKLLETNGPFHLVITDMNMPVMDGIGLAQAIRKMDAVKDIPIIMATTESEKSQVRVAKNSGVNDFISKPIPVKVLEKKILKYLAN